MAGVFVEILSPRVLAISRCRALGPPTVGYALDDSPVGLLAWIFEKFQEWTDLGHDGPSRTVDPDTVVANVTAYWLHRDGSASAQFLYDAQHAARDWGVQPAAPRGWSVFGGGGSVVRRLMDPDHEISWWTEHVEGGHFAAMETPELFVNDIRDFFRARPTCCVESAAIRVSWLPEHHRAGQRSRGS